MENNSIKNVFLSFIVAAMCITLFRGGDFLNNNVEKEESNISENDSTALKDKEVNTNNHMTTEDKGQGSQEYSGTDSSQNEVTNEGVDSDKNQGDNGHKEPGKDEADKGTIKPGDENINPDEEATKPDGGKPEEEVDPEEEGNPDGGLDPEEDKNPDEGLDSDKNPDKDPDEELDPEEDKTDLEVAIEEIKGGNINFEEFKNNILILIANNYTDSQIGELIDMTDSDGDGLSDHLEKIYGTDKAVFDTDGDGLSDGYEANLTLTDPSLKDSDDNGILDKDEDLDGDGLTNEMEVIHETNPRLKDTDGDGVDDFQEVSTYNTNPNSKDTDGDTIEDYDEIFVTKTNPLVADGDSVVVVEEQVNNDFANLSIKVEGQAKELQTSYMMEVPKLSILSPENITGMHGTAYDFSSLGDFNRCMVDINIVNGATGVEYGLYYLNEEEGTFLEAPSYSRGAGDFTAELTMNSKYVILDKSQRKKAQEDFKMVMQRAYEGASDRDSDNDGFSDDIDPTPAKADFFKSYEAYVKHFYGDKDVVTTFVDQPKPGTPNICPILGGFKVGHTFMSYNKGNSEYYSGFYPQNGSAGNTLFMGDIDTKISTFEGVYQIYEDTEERKLYTYNENFTEKNNYDKYHSWNIALPIVFDSQMSQKFLSYPRDYRDLYNLYHNNCTTFVTDFLKESNVQLLNYNDDLEPEWREKLFFTGGTPGFAGYYIDNKYPLTSVKNEKIVFPDGISRKVYYSEMSKRLSINVDSSLEDDYEPTIDKVMEFNGHYYGVIKIKDKDYKYKTEWDHAKAIAEKLGGYLAVITSKEEDDFCYSLAKEIYGISSCYFGLSDANAEGLWQWVNGEELSYQNWQDGEPNNEGGNEDYGMYYYRFGSSKWNDGSGNDGVGMYLVEFEEKPELLN